MFKSKSSMYCAFLVLLCAAVTFGAAVKVRAIPAAGVNGLAENPDADGMAILNYHSGNNATEVQVIISDFLPNTTYGVKVEGGISGFSDPIAITTNAKGNGNYHNSTNFDITTNATVTIYIWDGDIDSIFEISADELRAEGSA